MSQDDFSRHDMILYPLLVSFYISDLLVFITSNFQCHRYDTKLYLVVRLKFRSLEKCEVTTLILVVMATIFTGVEVPVKIPFMGQVDLFEKMKYVFTQLLCPKQDVTQGQFLSCVQLI